MSDPPPTEGEAALAADGYRFVEFARPADDDYDGQGHLNNAVFVRLFNDQRIEYILNRIGMWWPREMRAQRYVAAVREMHVLYESEALPGELLVGGLKYVRVEGKATIIEQRFVESEHGRAVARAWIVHLLVQDGTVVEWPASYVAAVSEIEGRTVEVRAARTDRRWGPPD